MKCWFSFVWCLPLAFGGCSHQAKKHVAPDITPVQSRVAKAATHFAAAKVTHRVAIAKTKEIKFSTAQESQQIETLRKEIKILQLAVPTELKGKVSDFESRLENLAALHVMTLAHVTEVENANLGTETQLNLGQVALTEVTERYGPSYFAAVQKQTVDFNELDVNFAKADAALLKYRLQRWTSWLILGAGILALVVLGVLRALNRAR